MSSLALARKEIRRLASLAASGGSGSYAVFQVQAWQIAYDTDPDNRHGLHYLFSTTVKSQNHR